MIKLQRPICPNTQSLADSKYDHPDNKKALIDASYGKCMYCESYVLSVSFGEVEHIKPKSIFPNLEFDWNNLGFVCQRCNNSKNNKYNEETQHINPYDENPEDFLFVSGTFILHKNTRGEKTVNDISLNREGLLEKRLEAINRLEKSLKACFHLQEPLKSELLEELKKEISREKEFSFVLKDKLKLS